MQIEISKENIESQVELIEQDGNQYTFSVDGKMYDLNIVMVENGAYSIIHEGKSYNLETIPGDKPKKYTVNTILSTYEIELVDAASRYSRARQGDEDATNDKQIIAPMPGKIVSVMAVPGQEVKQGDTLVIVSAMKMESEYKAGTDGIVQEVLVKNDDTIDGGQIMIIIE
ncbi:MAG: acetyl-CoA carboxylase biotin carboxyl carrier protein subunit [Bacteroidales bacterium]|nr:acetyl-CoA carboxylase biotin carboxyl carrier protein subunit [Bacteroidales bacterium]